MSAGQTEHSGDESEQVIRILLWRWTIRMV